MMDLNLTLVGQMITFIVFVWFTMKYIWPPLTKALEERRQKMADGLAAGEKGQQELLAADGKSKEILAAAKTDAAGIVDQANKRAAKIIDDAKEKAREESARIVKSAEGEIEQEFNTARSELMRQVSSIAVQGAEKILGKEIDKSANADMIDKMIAEVG